ncbi:MAG: hypothetical protein ACRCX8_10090 [Sarcina sp.]
MEKIEFLNVIERAMDIQFTKSQLEYFFTSNRYVAMSSPRNGGKSFVVSMDSLYTCTAPNKKACIIFTHRTEIDIIKHYISNVISLLENYIQIQQSTVDRITFNNGSEIIFKHAFSCDSLRGYKFNKITLIEPDSIKNLEEIINNNLEPLIAIYTDAQIKLIGTHEINSINLLSYMMNSYYYTIRASHRELPISLTSEEVIQLKQIMGRARYELEMENRITPNILMSICEAVTRRK